MRDDKLLLDTCALVWLVAGAKDISKKTLDKINRAEVVCVSAISAWEISLKVARDQIELPKDVKAWFAAALDRHNLFLIPLDVDLLVEANKLPWHHRDPADRFIIAAAIRENAAIVTADKKFHQYDVDVMI